MDADIALADLASGMAVPIRAECGCGVHAGPPGFVWKHTKRSMAGPLFSLQVSFTTVKWGAIHRWMVGGKLCLLLNQWGLVVAWECATANVADNTFQWLIRQFEERMIVLSDTGFHAAEGDPANLKLCQRGEWEDRMLVETVFSMLTLVSHCKKVMHRGWE